MDNPKFSDKVKYELIVVASGLSAGGIFIGLIAALSTRKYAFLIISVIGLVLYKPLGTMRANARRAAEYDSSGQRVSMKDPMRMSKKDRDAMDKAKLFREQQICPTTTTDRMTHPGSETPDEDIARLIGLKPVKEKVADMTARMAFENRDKKKKKKKKDDSKAEVESRHMVFYGSPGTGKTTIARIMAGYLYKYGYIRKNKCLEIDGNFLKAGEYSAEKTSIVIRRAMGGVLFIDEAYALMGDQAGAEAVATLIKEMEDHRGDFVLILAGYTNEMRQLLEYNPGFASRVKEYLTFPDYNAKEMEQIFELMAKSKGFSVDAAAYPRYDRRVASERELRSFGNGRTARNILEETLDRHARNYMEGKLDKADEFVIVSDDISPEVKNSMFMESYR